MIISRNAGLCAFLSAISTVTMAHAAPQGVNGHPEIVSGTQTTLTLRQQIQAQQASLQSLAAARASADAARKAIEANAAASRYAQQVQNKTYEALYHQADANQNLTNALYRPALSQQLRASAAQDQLAALRSQNTAQTARVSATLAADEARQWQFRAEMARKNAARDLVGPRYK